MNKALLSHIEEYFDPSFHKLAKDLIGFDGIFSSLARHAKNSPKQWGMPEGSWFITFKLDFEDDIAGLPSARGYMALAFLSYVINGMFTEESEVLPNTSKVKLFPTCNFDDEGVSSLQFYIQGQDITPDSVADKIAENKRIYYPSRDEYLQMIQEYRKIMEEEVNFEDDE